MLGRKVSAQTLFLIISLSITLSGVIITGLAYLLTRRSDNRRAFLDQLSLYYSEDVQLGLEKLWMLYRQECENDLDQFLDTYVKVWKEEKDRCVPVNQSLHFQRRKVTQFYRSLGGFLKQRLIPRKMAYQWWAQVDVDIVERLLIPLENRIARILGVSELNQESDPLHYLAAVKHKFYKTVK